jgi:hypothetical protein
VTWPLSEQNICYRSLSRTIYFGHFTFVGFALDSKSASVEARKAHCVSGVG